MFILLICGNLLAQQIPGAGRDAKAVNKSKNGKLNSIIAGKIERPYSPNDLAFATTTYTFADLVVFSYFDNSNFIVLNSSGEVIDEVTLNSDEFHIFSPGTGVYRIEGSNSFTLLIGDPVSASILGYFAVDESGRPVSTRLNTYMPSYYYGGEHFIIFGYSDNTEFIVKNLSTGATVASGILNEGEHFQLDGYLNIFLGVYGSKPVSALSYTDQGYFIPATNGTFAGNHFYGFSGYVGGWPNSITITAYHDDTEYVILNSADGDTISSGILNQGEATDDYVIEDTYWEVKTSNICTVNNTPYGYYSALYYHLTRQIDESGFGIGTNFYSPVIIGEVDIFSYEDENEIKVVDMSTLETVWTGTLNSGEGYNLYSNKTVYHITGTKNLSVISSEGGSFGADFMPLNFASTLPDLSISGEDIILLPDVENRSPNDPITIEATVHNYGFETAQNVAIRIYDGDPDGGVPISQKISTNVIEPGGSHTFTYDWNVPENPTYHAVYVLVDPDNDIVESNSSNNLASKYIIPNDDLLPPLSTVVDAPAAVKVIEDIPDFTQFEIKVNIFNTGSVDATNVSISISLPEGLSLGIGYESSQSLGTLSPQQGVQHSWMININDLNLGDAFYYNITVDSDNSDTKIVERRLIINRGTSVSEQNMSSKPDKYFLYSNFPNPFNPVTTVRYDLPVTAPVKIQIFDALGRKIAVLVDQIQSAGIHSVRFDGSSLGTGIYFIRMETPAFSQVKKMVLMK